jgi:hypothetical protein
MLDEEQCRQYARKFLMRSRQTNNLETKAAMIEIALYWTQLAAKAAERSLGAPHEQHACMPNSPSLVPEESVAIGPEKSH